MELADFKRKKTFLEEHQDLFTPNQVDWWIRHRESNGLSDAGALVKAANQWYFNEENFTEWFINQKA